MIFFIDGSVNVGRRRAILLGGRFRGAFNSSSWFRNASATVAGRTKRAAWRGYLGHGWRSLLLRDSSFGRGDVMRVSEVGYP